MTHEPIFNRVEYNFQLMKKTYSGGPIRTGLITKVVCGRKKNVANFPARKKKLKIRPGGKKNEYCAGHN